MNNRKPLAVIAAVVALALVYQGWTFFKPPAAPSGAIVAQPVALPATSAPAPAATDGITPQAAGLPSETGPLVFQILSTGSQARFEIDEVLRNVPTHVVGTTDQVSGEIALDPENAAAAKIGVIQINARALVTDSEFRNRSIKNKILLTDQHEFVRFTPTTVSGLPARLAVGESASFHMTGDLEIIGNTKPAAFSGTVTLVDPKRLEGSASTTVTYADFGVVIPAARSVNAVEQTVLLGIDFAAAAP